jgi:hypothetical protein
MSGDTSRPICNTKLDVIEKQRHRDEVAGLVRGGLPVSLELNLTIPVKREPLEIEYENLRQLLEAVAAECIALDLAGFTLPLLTAFEEIMLDVAAVKEMYRQEEVARERWTRHEPPKYAPWKRQRTRQVPP